MLSSNLPKWVVASAAKYFTAAVEGTTTLFVDGIPRKTAGGHWAELRSSFRMRELSKGYFRIEVDIAIVVSVLMNTNDAYLIHKINGTLATAMSTIGVYRFGETDETLVGCLRIRDAADVVNYGEVRAGDIKQGEMVVQSSVSGTFEMEISDG